MLVLSAMPADSDEPDVPRLNRDYCAAYNAGDLEKLLAFFSEDAITLSPDQAPLRGREAHRKNFAAAFARETVRKLKLTSIRSGRSGELLYDAGEWAQPGVGNFTGYYLTVYRREQGGWKILTSLFNVKQ